MTEVTEAMLKAALKVYRPGKMREALEAALSSRASQAGGEGLPDGWWTWTGEIKITDRDRSYVPDLLDDLSDVDDPTSEEKREVAAQWVCQIRYEAEQFLLAKLRNRYSPTPADAPKGDGWRDTIQTLLDLLNPLHGELDKQLYDERMQEELEIPKDREYSVNITEQQERDLTQAVLILENRRRTLDGHPLYADAPKGDVRRALTDDELRTVLIFAQGCSNWTGETEGEVCREEARGGDCGCIEVVRALRTEIDGRALSTPSQNEGEAHSIEYYQAMLVTADTEKWKTRARELLDGLSGLYCRFQDYRTEKDIVLIAAALAEAAADEPKGNVRKALLALLDGVVRNTNFYKPETPDYEFVQVPLQYLRQVREAYDRLSTPSPSQDEGELMDVDEIRRRAVNEGRWPDAVSDGSALPCSDCGESPRFTYHVADEFWRRHVPEKPARLSVVCLPCLDRRCGGIGLAEALEEIQWTGIGHTVVLKPTFRHVYEPKHPPPSQPSQEDEGGLRRALELHDRLARLDERSGDSDLWTEEYREACEATREALSRSPVPAPSDEMLRRALERFIDRLTYPVSTKINKRGYEWRDEGYLDFALNEVREALSQSPEETK